ncbi:MAG TPA: carbonic anhydrase, partial [Anaerotignum lactatifermentans]|nr:carbonic anhydrase [Anaerotignum lactatifermentans]
MNDSVKKMLEYNRVFVDHEMYQRYATTKYPDRKIAILSCMDTRMTELLPAALGIKNGDVKLIKNAGGQITHPYGSVIFSLLVAVYELGVDTILVIGHDDCGGRALDAKKMIAKMEEKGISRDVIDHVDANHKNLEQWLTGFGDICTSVQNTVDTIRNHPL